MIPVTIQKCQQISAHVISTHILMSVDNGRQVDLASINLELQLRRDPIIPGVSMMHHRKDLAYLENEAHSGGLAGSMITDCLVGSSVTR